MTAEIITVAEAANVILKAIEESPVPLLIKEIEVNNCSMSNKRAAVGRLVKEGKIVRTSARGSLYKYSVPNKNVRFAHELDHLERMLLPNKGVLLNITHGYSLC